MANRYWVGGTGTWDTTNTANWSATSGGAGGASVPGPTDDVFFDANSGTGVLTLSQVWQSNASSYIDTGAINNLNFTNISTGLTLSTTSPRTMPPINGTLTFPSSNSLFASEYLTWMFMGTGTSKGIVNYRNTGTNVLLVYNGTLTLSQNLQNFLYGVVGPFSYISTNRSAVLNYNGFKPGYFNVNVQRGGTLNVGSLSGHSAGGFSADAGGTINFNTASSLTCSLTRNGGTINLNSATISLTGITGASGTLNTGTSTVYGGDSNIDSATTWYKYQTGSNRTIGTISASNNVQLLPTGTNSWYRLSGNISCSSISLRHGNTGTASDRGFIFSSVVGTPRTISASSFSEAVTSKYLDFADTTFSGGISGTTGTEFGDLGGNSNINFPAGRSLYWVGGTGTWGSSANWSSSSGGAGGQVPPRPQDDVTVDGNSGSGTITLNSTTWGGNVNINNSNISITSSSQFADFVFARNARLGGNLTITSGTIVAPLSFSYVKGGASPGAANVNVSATANSKNALSLASYSLGGLSFQSNAFLKYLYCQGGTSTTNNYNITIGEELRCSNESGSFYGNLNCGTSTITFNGRAGSQIAFINMGANSINAANATFVVDPDVVTPPSTLVFNFDTGPSFAIGKLIYRGSVDYQCTFTFEQSNCTIGEIVNETNSGTLTLAGPSGQSLNIAKWSANGVSGRNVVINGGRYTYTGAGVVDGDYLTINSSTVSPSTLTWYAGSTSTDGGSNSGWIFTDPPGGGSGFFFGSNF